MSWIKFFLSYLNYYPPDNLILTVKQIQTSMERILFIFSNWHSICSVYYPSICQPHRRMYMLFTFPSGSIWTVQFASELRQIYAFQQYPYFIPVCLSVNKCILKSLNSSMFNYCSLTLAKFASKILNTQVYLWNNSKDFKTKSVLSHLISPNGQIYKKILWQLLRWWFLVINHAILKCFLGFPSDYRLLYPSTFWGSSTVHSKWCWRNSATCSSMRVDNLRLSVQLDFNLDIRMPASNVHIFWSLLLPNDCHKCDIYLSAYLKYSKHG